MVLFQAVIGREAAGAMPPILDADVADACASTAATLETARKGIIYEHQTASVPAQRVAAELKGAIAELTGQAGVQASRVERDAAVALRQIERMARAAAGAFTDAVDAKTAWLAFVRRVTKSGLGEAGGGEDRAPSTQPPPDPPRIIIP